MLYVLLRLALLALVIWYGVRLLRRWRVRDDLPAPREPDRFERTVRCTTCGVHLPASAASADGRCGKCAS